MIRKNVWFWLAAIASLALDQLTKRWVVTTFTLSTPPETRPLWPGVFHLTYVTNSGAAFSLFEGVDWLRWLSLVVCVGLIGWGIWGPRLPAWEQWGYGFLLGGAAGNGIDRFWRGAVTDFLDFRLIQFPVFNFADIFINVGIVCLLLAAWRGEFRKPSPRSRN
ncbi:lipoprotein signal peptidase [Synechococcales cyanobacterium C]|uniref:Lipoprotein signal peptidase n=1 Tax=Petrachloros mirabilis ULC683 TaxID=2781853 RepID=A0A8K1ZWN2_9CYAN|nr:signal peptidase II [Petrachloros mirabilis]NCJ05032.1 lipoprotein signal peptidase [Petrachloros mirabilis ULC683]